MAAPAWQLPPYPDKTVSVSAVSTLGACLCLNLTIDRAVGVGAFDVESEGAALLFLGGDCCSGKAHQGSR